MQWTNLLAKLSPERTQPILRDGQCKPVSGYNKVPNMPSDHQDSPPEQLGADDQDESRSISASSLLAPPTSHPQSYNYPSPHLDPHEQHSFLDGLLDSTTSHDHSIPLATPTFTLGSPVASMGPMRTLIHSDYLEGVTLPNTLPLSPHWLHGQVSPPRQPLVHPDGYAPAESLPPQNYVSPVARPVASSSAPFFPSRSGGVSLFSQAQVAPPPILSIHNPTTLVPPNSELARTPRFTFAPPGADVPADPVTSTPAPSPTSARSWRDKAKAKLEKSSQQSTQEGSGRRRSNSWTVVSSVFRRRSGRQSGPAPLTTSDGPAQLTASNWRDLAQWAYRSIDNTWGESFVPEVDTSLPIEREASSSTYDQTLPPLPPHLSHLSAPSAPLVRVNSSTSALNPFLVHRSVGLPLLSWDLRTAARAILFPASGPGASAVPMAASDYSQPATWPPTGALRIGAIGGHAGWRWPVDVRNPAGVRCGDLFRALIANLHEFVLPYELADMSPENVALIIAACTARVAAGFPHGWTSVPSSSSSFAPDGIRRVDCLLGYTLFHGLGPGPGTGEWTMFVGAP